MLRWGGATRCHRYVYSNAGLCGDLVSVGTVGTSYAPYGIRGTALGTACTSRLEDQIAYLTCIRNPSGCTFLYAARPPPGQRVRACDALSVAERLGGCGWGTQGPELWLVDGHHAYRAGAAHEPDEPVRFLPPSTLRVALNDGGY